MKVSSTNTEEWVEEQITIKKMHTKKQISIEVTEELIEAVSAFKFVRMNDMLINGASGEQLKHINDLAISLQSELINLGEILNITELGIPQL